MQKKTRCLAKIALYAGTFSIAGCSLAGPVLQGATDYNEMASNYSDQVLVASILRARDSLPIDMTNLSTITGSMSVQGTLALTVPFGNGPGSRNSAAPTVMGTSSPTWNMAPLNTQGFTLGMLQPVSPTYLASKWDSGIDHRFLLMLFIKSMRFADQPDAPFLNNPDSTEDIRLFLDRIKEMLGEGPNRESITSNVKSLTLMEPIGPVYSTLAVDTVQTTVSPLAATSGVAQSATMDCLTSGITRLSKAETKVAIAKKAAADQAAFMADRAAAAADATAAADEAASAKTPGDATATAKAQASKQAAAQADAQKTSADQADAAAVVPTCGISTVTAVNAANPFASTVLLGLNLATGLGDGSYHVGNAGPTDARSNYTGLQLYRQYASQVVLCTNDPKIDTAATTRSAVGQTVTKREKEKPLVSAAQLQFQKDLTAMSSLAKTKPSPAAAATTGGVNNSQGSPTKAGSAPSGNSPSAAASMTAAMQANQISAIVHLEICHKDQLVLPASTERASEINDARTFSHIEWRSISEIIQYLGAIVRNQNRTPTSTWTSQDQAELNSIFTIQQNQPVGLITVTYRSRPYSVAEASSIDHSAQALSILNDLIGAIKVSSDLPVTQQFQVIP